MFFSFPLYLNSYPKLLHSGHHQHRQPSSKSRGSCPVLTNPTSCRTHHFFLIDTIVLIATQKSFFTSKGEHNAEIMRVEDPMPLITVSQPTDPKYISKEPQFHFWKTHSNIPFTAPKLEADTIVQSPHTVDKPLPEKNINPFIPVISKYYNYHDENNNLSLSSARLQHSPIISQ